MKIAVVVATLGRPVESNELLADLHAQTRRPDAIVFAVMSDADAPPDADGVNAKVIICERKGSCAQRNIALDALDDSCDVVVFFDDDFVPGPNYLEALEKIFTEREDVVGVTGHVLADGVTGPGLSRQESVEIVEQHAGKSPDGEPWEHPRNSLYGCNMAVRISALKGRRFDESLPLYGWLEDVDLTYPLLKEGTLVQTGRAYGVHRGVKGGRTSGVRFGYSQIVNPLYLLGKGTGPRAAMFSNIFRNLAMNHARSIVPELYIDRRGRLKGNWRAIADVLRGRVRPERILDF